MLTFSASGSINIFSFLTCICLYSHLCVHSKHRGLSSTVGWPWLQALLRVSPRTLAWEMATQLALRNCLEEERERPVYMWFFFFFFARKHLQSSIHHGKRVLLVTKNRHLMVMILGFFHVWEEMTLGSLESFLRYASNYLGACLSKAQSASFCFHPDGGWLLWVVS